jgi:hypothetical protein
MAGNKRPGVFPKQFNYLWWNNFAMDKQFKGEKMRKAVVVQ